MWPELRDQIEVEEAQLQKLLEMHRPLLEQCHVQEPNTIELSALGALLHSFYNGTENLFRRVALELGDPLPEGHVWHQHLLQEMAVETPHRPPVLSSELRDRLKPYLHFRHVFRHAYAFELQWKKMAPLVLNCEEILRALQQELATFAQAMESA